MIFNNISRTAQLIFISNKTALIRPFHRNLNIENWCRNKEMASYFAKMTFFKNLQKDTWCQKNKFFCFQLKKYAFFF